MIAAVVRIEARRISDRTTFHDVFAEAFGFPNFYGRNMDAWIDCMRSVRRPDDGMSTIHAPPGGVVVIALDHAEELFDRCPEIFEDLVDCTALVNQCLLESGEGAALALSYNKSRSARIRGTQG